MGNKDNHLNLPNAQVIIVSTSLATTASFLAIAIVKISFILTLLGITVCCARYFFRFVAVTFSMVVVVATVFIWVDCHPLSLKWDSQTEGSCWPDIFNIAMATVVCG